MDREDRLKTGLILAVLLVDAAAFAALGLRFDWPSAWKVAAAWPTLMALGWFYMHHRRSPPLAHLLRETAHLAAFSAAAAMLSYVGTAAGRPLVDEALIALDRAIGFDWLSYVGFFNHRPRLGTISSILYLSTLPQVAVAAILLPALGLVERAREFVLAVMIAALAAILVAAIFPSAGALAYLHPDADFYLRNVPVVDLAYKDEFFRMRAREIGLLSLDAPKGLIAFPSYHVALSVLVALAFRHRMAFFVPLGLLNLGVILSTPVDGGHHLIDGLGGAGLALASLWIANRIRAWLWSASPAPASSRGEGPCSELSS